MLAEGFNLIDIFPFLKAVYPKFADTFDIMQADLLNGKLFSETVGHMHVKGTIQYQIQTVEQFGDMATGLKTIATYIEEMALQKKTLQQTLAYPISLIILMIGMLVAMRTFMLPQLASMVDGETEGVVAVIIFLLSYLPQIAMVSAVFIIVAVLFFKLWHRRINSLKRAQTYVKLPIIGPLMRLYYSYFFAYEFSQLFKLGYSVQQIIDIFTAQIRAPFLQAFGDYLQGNYIIGMPFAESLAKVGVFTNEFSSIVQQGEMLNQLAVRMRLYSKRCLKQYYLRLNQTIKIVQNSLFILVGLTIVSVYLTLMLPMLTMIGDL